MTMLRRLAFAAAVGTSCPALLAAQAAPAAPLPAAQSLIARFIDAVGGRAAIEQLGSRWERGRAEVSAAGLTLSFEAYYGSGRLYTRSEMPGFGVIHAGFDGQVAWSINPATGPLIRDGVALRQTEQAADPLAVLHPDRYVAAMQTVEEGDFTGARCYKVRITTPWHEEYFEFFERETGLLRGSIRSQVTAEGSFEVTSQIVEWRSVAGVRLPRVTRSTMAGREIVTNVDSTEVRVIPDSVFALPPEIRALRPGS
jgi:hypothetical protein